jgi:N-methylhydantoinase B
MPKKRLYDQQAVLQDGSLENIWLRLVSIADEAATTLIRTAYSVTIRESRDLTVVISDAKGHAIVECSNANPSFIGTLPRTIRAFLNQIPPDSWNPGDLIITNDPWIGSGHLQDITMASPVFINEHLVAFVLIAAHGPDIGGSLYSAMSREIFEEGLRIPICHYAINAQRNDLVREFIRSNVRVPNKVIGDLEGMAACSETAGNKIKKLIGQISIEVFDFSVAEIISRSRDAMERAIEKIPDGLYRSAATTSGIDLPLLIQCEIEVKGRQLRVSFDGTSPVQSRGINVPFCYTYAHTIYPLKSLLLPDVPNNHGTLEPFIVDAPEGSLLNPAFPAPVAARHLTGQFLSGVVVRALADVLPLKAFAECGVTRPQLIFSGKTEKGDRFVEHIFMVSGIGARKGSDGQNALCFPANTTATPVEIIESMTPLVVECREILPDSGGRGEWRGGCGQRMRVRNRSPYPVDVSILAELSHRGASGLQGGGAGTPTRIWVDGVSVPGKARLELMPNSVLTVESAGGGGYGLPENRSPLHYNQDLEKGYVSNILVG